LMLHANGIAQASANIRYNVGILVIKSVGIIN
jgi:hypothetical protein